MESFQLLINLALATSFVLGTSGESTGLEEMIETLKADIETFRTDIVQLRNDKDSEISLLKSEIMGLKAEVQLSEAPLLFDCYLSNTWSGDGVIRFDGCAGKFITTLLLSIEYLSFPACS